MSTESKLPPVSIVIFGATDDSAWSIAQKFDLQPETILWGNEGLSASAGSLKAGTILKILPVDGVLHTAQEEDTLERIEAIHGTPTQEIYEYPGNEFDLTQPPFLKPGWGYHRLEWT